MDYEMLMQFIRPDLVIIVAVLWCLGYFIKTNKNWPNDWMIPFILLVAGILLVFVYSAFVLGAGINAKTIVESVIQGILVSCVAVFGNEIKKQSTIKRLEDEQD